MEPIRSRPGLFLRPKVAQNAVGLKRGTMGPNQATQTTRATGQLKGCRLDPNERGGRAASARQGGCHGRRHGCQRGPGPRSSSNTGISVRTGRMPRGASTWKVEKCDSTGGALGGVHINHLM